MNLNPIPKLRAVSRRVWPPGEKNGVRKFSNADGELATIVRLGDPMGPWTDAMGGFEPRKVNPVLYEALREALPILDGAIGRLVELDGIIRVRGDNDKILAEIEDWMRAVSVNDAEKGLQALYESQGNERYEQGFGIAEWVADKKSADIIGLRVADSKGVHFRRDASGLQVYYRPPGESPAAGRPNGNIEQMLRGGIQTPPDATTLLSWGYKPLDRSRLLYTVNQPDADNPYGTSVLRSLEFTGQSLLVIQNALQRSWTRWGDPPLLAIYKCSNKKVVDTPGELDRRRDQIAGNIRKAMEEKGKGNSVDVVQAIGKDDDLVIQVIGAEGVVLELEAPARHLLEQIVSKVGLPPWMLGLQFSTSERMAEQQAGMALQGSKTRFERRLPDLTHLVSTMLRMRGRTWKRGDWELHQELPNIQDQLKAAQAGFLVAQTAMMSRGAPAEEGSPRGVDNNLRSSRGPAHKHARKATDSDEDEEGEGYGETWAEDDPALPRIEADANRKISAAWKVLATAVLAALILRDFLDADDDGEPGAAGWQFDFAALPALLAAGDTFAAVASAAVGTATVGAWTRGLDNAAAQIPGANPINITAAVVAHLRSNGMARVTNTLARSYTERIANVLVAGVYNGLAPAVVARQLRREFDLGDYDWQRLVASELAAAHGAAKVDQMAANGIEQYDWSTAGDASVCAICAGHREGGPYAIGQGPLPMTDSHPLCRCSVIPYLPPT